MLKRIARWWFGLFVTLALAVVFLPLLYAMVLFMALLLPLIIVFACVFEKREAYRIHNLKEALTSLFLGLIVLPLALLALAAPLRSIMIATLSFFPTALAKFYEIHQPFYDLFIPVFGQLFSYWLDFYWGIYAVVLIFIAALLDSIRRNMLVRQIEILPTSKVHSAAIGLVELKGKAVYFEANDTEGKAPIMRAWLESTDDGHRSRSEAYPFYLDDGSGRMLIDPADCHISADNSYFEIKLHHAIFKTFKPETGFAESRLTPGDDVYVLGNLQIIRDEVDKKRFPNDTVFIKPQKSSILRPNFYDLFFLSNTSEEELLALFRKSIHRGWIKILFCMAISGWLSVYAWNNINQINSFDMKATPALLQLLSTPTRLEQHYEIAGLGQRTNFEWLKLLQQGHENGDAIMDAMQEQGLEKLAIPILLKQASDIDHAGFALAHTWLGKMQALPVGLRGVQYWSRDYEQKNETLILRVLLNLRDGGLYTSYRAKFGGSKSQQFELKKRYIVFEFDNRETGIIKERMLSANEGMNIVDDVEVFEYFLPGEYSFDMYARREYEGGAVDKGSRKREAVDLSLD